MRSDGSLSSPIDFFDCLYVWAHAVESCELLLRPFSDHCAVSLICPIPEPVPRSPGRWKLNTSILSDQSFKDSVSSFWLGWKKRKSSFETIPEWWDVGKSKLKDVRAQIFQHWFFSETFTCVRWRLSYVKNVKKLGSYRLRSAENMPGRSPQIWKNRASLANYASVCKPKNIAIKSSKWNVLCQILFKWTY